MAEGRNDYTVILAGGTIDKHPLIVINQENHKEIDNPFLDAIQRDTDWWDIYGKDCLAEIVK